MEIVLINLVLVLNEKIDQKSNCQPQVAGNGPYKRKIRSKQGENEVFMHNYKKLNLLLFLILKFYQNSTFSPDWNEVGLIRTE